MLKDLQDKKRALTSLGERTGKLQRDEGTGGAAARLRELNELLQQKLITQEEFNARRKKVVEGIGELP